MPMVWQDWSDLNKKYNDVWMAGLGGGVFDGGDVLQAQPMMGLGATGLGAMTFVQIQTLQDLLNMENDYLGREYIPVTGVWDPATCLTVAYFNQILTEGGKVNQYLYDTLENWQYDIVAACQALSQAPPPTNGGVTNGGVTNGGVTNGGTTTTNGGAAPDACRASGCDCYVYEGDAGPHVTRLQEEINVALAAGDYEGIAVSGVYDKQTCGAIFELGGSFKPSDESFAQLCDPYMTQEWLVPLQCADMVIPKKKGGPSRAGMFAIGGLVLAAGLGGAYWIAQS